MLLRTSISAEHLGEVNRCSVHDVLELDLQVGRSYMALQMFPQVLAEHGRLGIGQKQEAMVSTLDCGDSRVAVLVRAHMAKLSTGPGKPYNLMSPSDCQLHLPKVSSNGLPVQPA